MLSSGRAKAGPLGMMGIQKDVYSASMRRLGNAVVRAYYAKKPQNPDEATRDAVDVLRNWNGQMEKGTPAPSWWPPSYISRFERRL